MMIVNYIWYDKPDVIKKFNTVKDLAELPDIFNQSKRTQEEYDKQQLELIRSKKEQGLVLDFWIEERL